MKTIHDFPEVAAQAQRLEKLKSEIRKREAELREVLDELERGRASEELQGARALLVQAIIADEPYDDELARRQQVLRERHVALLAEMRALRAVLAPETATLNKLVGEASARFLPSLRPEFEARWRAWLEKLAEVEGEQRAIVEALTELSRAGWMAPEHHIAPTPYALVGGTTRAQSELALKRGLITERERAALLEVAAEPKPETPTQSKRGPVPQLTAIPLAALHGPSVGRVDFGMEG